MSKLQKSCPNYTQLRILAKPGGCLYTVPWGTPKVSSPLGAQFLCWHGTFLGEYLAQGQGIGLPTYLPITGEGWPKATRHEKACLLDSQNLDYHCHGPPKTLRKFQKTGGTVTHSLQVVHSLLWHQP